jgi:hypothetical protein
MTERIRVTVGASAVMFRAAITRRTGKRTTSVAWGVSGVERLAGVR